MMPDIHGHAAKVRSKTDIARQAGLWRDALFVEKNSYVDIHGALQNKLPELYPEFKYLTVNRNDIDGAEGLTQFRPPQILMANDVDIAAESGEARARFSMAHELGHLVLHNESKDLQFHRMSNVSLYKINSKNLGLARSAEWQANQFAIHFLAPSDLVKEYETIEEIKMSFGISHQAATFRFNETRHLRPREIPQHIQEMIADLKKNTQ